MALMTKVLWGTKVQGTKDLWGTKVRGTKVLRGTKILWGKIVRRTEVRFASFLSGGFTTIAGINPPERKLTKRTSVQCQ